jgi:hypothetical protein
MALFVVYSDSISSAVRGKVFALEQEGSTDL